MTVAKGNPAPNEIPKPPLPAGYVTGTYKGILVAVHADAVFMMYAEGKWQPLDESLFPPPKSISESAPYG